MDHTYGDPDNNFIEFISGVHEAEELAARYIRDTLEDMGFTMERWDDVPDVAVRIALL
jgi:uncharacterized protein (DUF1015 family)